MTGRDREIDEALSQITGKSAGERLPSAEPWGQLCVRNILLVSTAYDYFLLEEEGRLSELFRKVYGQRELGYVPMTRHVASGERALASLDGGWVDLLVVFNPPGDLGLLDLARRAREKSPRLRIVYLANNTPELARMAASGECDNIDRIFTWHGDGKVFLAIVQAVEDAENYERDSTAFGVRGILLYEPSLSRLSGILPSIYDEIWEHTDALLQGDISHTQKMARVRRRPKVLLADSPDAARKLAERHAGKILCAVLDETEPHNGKTTLRDALEESAKGLPILSLVNSRGPCGPPQANARTADIDSPRLVHDVAAFVREALGPAELNLVAADGRQIARASDVWSLERAIWTAPKDVLERYLRNGTIVSWLVGRTEFELADEFARFSESGKDSEAMRRSVLEAISKHKTQSHVGTIANYSRESYGPFVRFSRLGGGALGGKARGLAFMDKIISAHVTDETFPGVRISIPRTVVLCTGVFEQFVASNRLFELDLASMPDDRIAAAFLEADLPITVLGDLRSFVEDVRTPIGVRSSSLLEDALFQPFAGVYESLMLPNSSNETDNRFQHLCDAVKFVFASTYFEKARSYIQATPSKIGDERMAVVIQEVAGAKHGDAFYPDISGVARSYDYWPFGSCENTDGMANVALGLGKTIVDGGVSFRFCPLHPNVPHYGSVRELMKQSQKVFYGVALGSQVGRTGLDDAATLVNLELEDAERDGVVEELVSTYDPQGDRLYPGTGRDGARVLDFGPMLQGDAFPLARIVGLMLRMGEVSLGCPVEIEFAITLDRTGEKPHEFKFLQVRSMVAKSDLVTVELGDIDKSQTLCQSDSVMGNGIVDGMVDFVYVKPETFEMANSQQVVPCIRKINKTLMNEGRPYILIGPGRWGSTDPWLGIPIIWSDIAGSKTIVETPVDGRVIDPSQGSHFFQNMSSLKLGYFTIKPRFAEDFDWNWLNNLPVVAEEGDVRHARSPVPVQVRIDGRTGRGAILKKAPGFGEAKGGACEG
ncbi:MAG: PEP/pyruvate-binding domain-containing protein [Methanobacteriota archaeon]